MVMLIDPVLEGLDSILAWLGGALGQNVDKYCELETADGDHTLVLKDGSLLSIIRLHGATELVGPDEFEMLHQGLTRILGSALNQPGHAIQVYFRHDKEGVERQIKETLNPGMQTAKRLELDLDDLFDERIAHLSHYCAAEECFLVLYTRVHSLSKQQMKQSVQNRLDEAKRAQLPPVTMKRAQKFLAAVPEIKDSHESFVRNTINDLSDLHLHTQLLAVHDALYAVRKSIDPDVTGTDWHPVLPGDSIPVRNLPKDSQRDLSDVLWPPLQEQLIPRDGEVLNLRTCRVGDRIYASCFIELFPQDIQPFMELFKKVTSTSLPWRVSFFIESNGLSAFGFKTVLASLLSFASTQNRLINASADLLRYFDTNTDDAVVKLRFSAATWAPVDQMHVLRSRSAELIKAIQSWGTCEVTELSGDPYGGALSSALALNTQPQATATIAPFSQIAYMLPFNRPASPWQTGALLLRSPDGKLWPYQPGSTQQTTWIDLIYARPGSGKSVLSNATNLALCLQGGIQRLPRIAIIDIGPSSSGLISLLKSALPKEKKHFAAYHRMQMTADYAINPFDTQLGARYPTPQERSFLVNFLTLLATPVGEQKAYDGIADMVGMIIDELYKNLADDYNPHRYSRDMDPRVDTALETIPNFTTDSHTTWWEITDVLFSHNHIHQAILAQRYAVPLMADTVAVARSQAIEDLYGKIIASTGEPLIQAFSRMISSAVREYPTLSRVTAFDLGEARVVSLDLDEVAKTGGEAADRQTAVMYMLARFILAKDFYLTEEALTNIPERYKTYHSQRILEIREDPKRLVMDEFHRTSKAQAVRDQVVVDMREGRKWRVQVALLSQSLDDFDPVMVEFATSIFIMDAGPKQAIDKSVETFGLTDTARLALANQVHGPRQEGATFLVQFSTKFGINTQVCTSTLGPIELWAFNTTAEDAIIRNELYSKIGAQETRRILSMLYPNGSCAHIIEQRLATMRTEKGQFEENESQSVVKDIINEILQIYNSMGASSMNLMNG